MPGPSGEPKRLLARAVSGVRECSRRTDGPPRGTSSAAMLGPSCLFLFLSKALREFNTADRLSRPYLGDDMRKTFKDGVFFCACAGGGSVDEEAEGVSLRKQPWI